MAPTLYDVKPEPGDLIEVFRGTYQHWALYIGDGFVVHLAPPSEVPNAGANSMMSVLTEKAVVKKEGLWDVVGTDKWEVNNSLDKKYQPREVHIIVRDARMLVGRELSYCVIRGNCEHFVNELRYGKAESRQVRKAGETVMAAGLAAMVGIGIVALAGTLFGSSKKEKEDTQ
ncbi:phospholipase A and acyltransferase 3-like [Thunnus albacares]|uniref:phospholipase A and acyltransferase 3-like n=1 Tax=Thunnus maccoyii TaxID=8240 RepID=UPI001C4BE5D3|nr:phospholipase A and acyltransferase 3-like [Thunnus maccoyii]XP_042274776.1 phospholipase A and acyltransferase 3-like [Thunnus maccoyii]XP_044218975.1 phospholipase A and acyltransferase 3-like [Thunnus albacares]XP_044218976.1 phospholipase A and acyltransferase 3-like [Thunnus albacares]XP_044218977.1 phospholipase A and acyltransferase 3-like [Thunnus albacares]XP_044218978.1 phospholipase A and acyltransferase 3-like [Thunnus albacares]XP_044218980.1 phospholipase A and acyltransferas|eukprot:superscaffoldBa00001277_g9885